MWWLARSSTCPPPSAWCHEPRPAGGRADAVGGEHARRVVLRGRPQIGEEVDRPVLVADRDDGAGGPDGIGDRAGVLARARDRLLEVHRRGRARPPPGTGRDGPCGGVQTTTASSVSAVEHRLPVGVGASRPARRPARPRARRRGRQRRRARRRPAPRCSRRAPGRSSRRRSCPGAGSRTGSSAASTAGRGRRPGRHEHDRRRRGRGGGEERGAEGEEERRPVEAGEQPARCRRSWRR